MRAAFVTAGIALCRLQLSPLLWFVVGATIAVLAALWPRTLFAWALLLLLGLSVFWEPVDPLHWRFFVLLAGLHLLHWFGTQLLTLPWHSRLQARALLPGARRFVLLQVPTQLGAWVVLTLFARHGSPGEGLPLFALLAAAGLVALGLVLLVPLLHERARSR